MGQYRKKIVQVEAYRWWKNGDHPKDDVWRPFDSGEKPPQPREGAVVRFFRHPGIQGESHCPDCGHPMNDHGFLDTVGGGSKICPGDWIITEPFILPGYYPCKALVFDRTYEEVPRPMTCGL